MRSFCYKKYIQVIPLDTSDLEVISSEFREKEVRLSECKVQPCFYFDHVTRLKKVFGYLFYLLLFTYKNFNRDLYII